MNMDVTTEFLRKMLPNESIKNDSRNWCFLALAIYSFSHAQDKKFTLKKIWDCDSLWVYLTK